MGRAHTGAANKAWTTTGAAPAAEQNSASHGSDAECVILENDYSASRSLTACRHRTSVRDLVRQLEALFFKFSLPAAQVELAICTVRVLWEELEQRVDGVWARRFAVDAPSAFGSAFTAQVQKRVDSVSRSISRALLRCCCGREA